MDLLGSNALKDQPEVDRRKRQWLEDDRYATLREYLAEIGTEIRRTPLIDPADAGAEARVLLVLEAPGTMADAAKGSGFASVDNNDQTAANCWRARKQVGLVDGVLQWNIVPWYLGMAKVKPTPLQLADGAIRLRHLMDLLPDLSTVVLCGGFAKTGYRKYVADLFEGNGPDVIETWHPSPSSLNFGSRREEFAAALGRAASRL